MSIAESHSEVSPTPATAYGHCRDRLVEVRGAAHELPRQGSDDATERRPRPMAPWAGWRRGEPGTPVDGPTLIGRDAELRAISGAVSAAIDHGGALVVRGDVGVGKSALLAKAVAALRANGQGVVAATGARGEAHRPFAGLHQLLTPLLHRVDDLLAVDQQTLRTAFGRCDRSVPAASSVTLAALALLTAATQDGPLVLVVDDAHWLDQASSEVLALVARRLAPLPVALVIAGRDGHNGPLLDSGLPELHVHPLDDDSATAMLDAVGGRLGARDRRRVLGYAAGNPLALIELSTAVLAPRTGGDGWRDPLPVSDRLARAFAERSTLLPPATRAVLMVASADEHASLSEVLAAAQVMDASPTGSIEDLEPAVAAGVVAHDHRTINFRHPLIPVAIYQTTMPAQRQRAHAALATVVTSPAGRVAWHRAASTIGTDEQTAAALDEAANDDSGSLPSMLRLDLAERAAELTPDMVKRRQRWVRAAELAVELGQPERGSGLIANVHPGSCDPVTAARRRLVSERTHPTSSRARDGLVSIIAAATDAADAGDTDAATQLLQAAADWFRWSDPGDEARRLVSAAAASIARSESDPLPLAIAAVCDPVRHGPALKHLATQIPADSAAPTTAFWLASALYASGMFERAATLSAEAVAGLRARGRRRLLPQALAQQAWTAVYTADWTLATRASEEATWLATDTRQPLWKAAAQLTSGMVAAVRGDAAAAESLISEAEATGMAFAANALLCDLQLVRAMLAIGAGRFDEAFHHLRRTFDPHDPAHHYFRSAWRIGEFVEAATRSGQASAAHAHVAAAAALADASQSRRIQVGLLYARPLLAAEGDPDEAEQQFQAGLNHDLTRWPTYWARLTLEYGTWLRRQRKIAEARSPLRAARDAFTALGAQPWVTKAEQELRASRETRNTRPHAWSDLTEQEQQIAQLAAQGLTNHEIGQQLYISHRTVGAHLYRVFPKLGVTSRAQLASVIVGQAADTRLAS